MATIDKKLSVAILHNTITPYRLPLFEELNNYYDVEVVFCEKKGPSRKWSTSLKGFTFKSTLLKSRRVGWVVTNRGLIKWARHKTFDVYIVADNNENCISIATFVIIAKLKKKPIIVWSEHTERRVSELEKSGVSYKLWKLAEAKYRKLLQKRAKAFLSMSGKYSDTFLINRGVDADKIFTNTQIMPKALLPVPDNSKKVKTPYVLYLGYFRREKGVDTLIKAWNFIKPSNFQLALVGDGPEKEHLKQLAENNSSIHFIGYTEGQAKAALIKNASALILPSMYEAWGLVVNESLYYGTPVISSSIVASTLLVEDKVNGLVVKNPSVCLFSECLSQFTSSKALQYRLKKSAQNYDKNIICSTSYGIRHFIKAIDYSIRS
jgi:glycosyltransferase involved in cell wall biosynthesis